MSTIHWEDIRLPLISMDLAKKKKAFLGFFSIFIHGENCGLWMCTESLNKHLVLYCIFRFFLKCYEHRMKMCWTDINRSAAFQLFSCLIVKNVLGQEETDWTVAWNCFCECNCFCNVLTDLSGGYSKRMKITCVTMKLLKDMPRIICKWESI